MPSSAPCWEEKRLISAPATHTLFLSWGEGTVLGSETRASNTMPSECFITELYPQPLFLFSRFLLRLYLVQDLLKLCRLALNSLRAPAQALSLQFFCLTSPGIWDNSCALLFKPVLNISPILLLLETDPRIHCSYTW